MAATEINPSLADFCRREHARLVGLLALYVGDVAVAEDLAQEAFVRLHQHWPRVQAMPEPRAWLSKVGINLARSWWRRHFAQQRAQRRLAAQAGHRPLGDAIDAAEVLTVRRIVATLPHRQRAVVVMRYYAGFSVAETAHQLGCPTGTVKSLAHRAIASLRTGLGLPDPDRDADPDAQPTPETHPEDLPHA